ncbi:MAG: hypothetical protein U0361_05390 [Nitrospiraceae bacterium]
MVVASSVAPPSTNAGVRAPNYPQPLEDFDGQIASVDVEPDKGVSARQHAMLFLNLKVFEREQRGRRLNLVGSDHQGHDDLFTTPSTLRIGIAFKDLTIGGGQAQQQVEIRAAGQNSPHGAAVQHDAFQGRPQERTRLLHIASQ